MALLVQLVPVGSAPRNIIRDLAQPLEQVFACQVTVGAALSDPKYAFNKDRRQYHSPAILRRLATLRTKPDVLMLGVADVDLFVPDRPFVMGEADREAKVAIVSLFRLRESLAGPLDTDVLRRRGQVEAVHEVGHLVGLSHCDETRCAMFFATMVAETDRKQTSLCNDCRSELGRLTPAPPA